MRNKIFSPVAMLLFLYVPYLICAVYAYSETNRIHFLIAFMVLALIATAFFLTMRGKYDETPKKLHWAAAGFGGLVTMTGAVLITSFLSDGILLNYIFITSIPVVYNIVGVANLTIKQGNESVLAYAGGALALPLILYFVVAILNSTRLESIALIFVICGYYALFFLIAHIVLIFFKRKGQNIIDNTKVTRVFYGLGFMLGVFLPLTGLVINQGFLGYGGGLFGDFSHPVFYLVAALNGGLILIPPVNNRYLRLLLFFLRSVGLVYVAYFCAAFLPVVPFGLIGMIIVLGVYVFAPYMLLAWQIRILINDWRVLDEHFDKAAVSFVFLVGIITIPVGLFLCVYNDKTNLNNAIAYVTDNPDDRYEKVDTDALARTLKYARGTYGISSGRGREFLDFGHESGDLPILSNIYSGYLMDGKVLSQSNVDFLNNIFLGAKTNTQRVQKSPVHSEGIESHVETKTEYDESSDVYRTWIHLELENSETSLAEYVTSFDLPEGVFVSDYYLYVGDEKKMGLLTDERAALFVYNRIVSQSRDPGILRYISDNTLELRVFPFAPNEVRKTGFELIHKQGFDFNIDGKSILVKGSDGFREYATSGAALLSAEAINELPVMERIPKYNFIIDCSKDSNILEMKEAVKEYAVRNEISDADVYFTTYKAKKSNIKDIDYMSIKQEGGFNLGLAARMVFNETRDGEFPVIIVVSNDISRAALPLSAKPDRYPESPYYYGLNKDFSLSRYRFLDNSFQDEVAELEFAKAAEYNGVAVCRDGQTHVVVTGEGISGLSNSQFESAILIRAESIRNRYNNEPNMVSNINNSFAARILTKNTAFIVVETKEQEKEILDMQERLLNGTGIEAGTERNMSEPSVIAVLIIVGALYCLRFRSRIE